MKRIRTSRYLILTTFVLILIVPITRFYTINPDVNACMLEYVDSLGGDNGNGFIYKIDGLNHIEPENSVYNKYLGQHKVGYSQGCIMVSGDLFTDFNNSVYCSQTYMIRKFVDHYGKEPEKSLSEKFRDYRKYETEFIRSKTEELELFEDLMLSIFIPNLDDVSYSLETFNKKFFEILEEV